MLLIGLGLGDCHSLGHFIPAVRLAGAFAMGGDPWPCGRDSFARGPDWKAVCSFPTASHALKGFSSDVSSDEHSSGCDVHPHRSHI